MTSNVLPVGTPVRWELGTVMSRGEVFDIVRSRERIEYLIVLEDGGFTLTDLLGPLWHVAT